MRFGILTGGGDAPGLNGILEAVGKTWLQEGVEILGILNGYEGIFKQEFKKITWDSLAGLHGLSGTFLGTSNRSKLENRGKDFEAGYQALGLEGLLIAGGDGTFLALNKMGVKAPVVGVPKTIDNDLQGTEKTFGFDTACTVVAEAVDALRFTAEAHQRVIVVEAMGRTAGWIALGGGVASYADAILIPELDLKLDKFKEYLNSQRHRKGLVIVCAESLHCPEEGLKELSAADSWVHYIEKHTEWEARSVVLGHLQRAKAPTTSDRFLTLEIGTMAAKLALQKNWEKAVVFRDGKVQAVPLAEVQGPPRKVPRSHPWVQFCRSVGILVGD